MIRARVYRSAKREFFCKIIESGEMILAPAMGNLLKRDESVVVGDYVSLEKDSATENFHIVAVEPRKNEVFRVIIREAKKKITAANCDLLVILTSVSKPEYKRGLIDRFLVRAQQWGIRPIVVFNKMDEYKNDKMEILFEQNRLKKLDVDCFEISAKYPDYQKRYLSQGFREFSHRLENQTAIFLGQSGVGKSEAISVLTGGEVNLKTHKVSRDGKGAHTTSWAEIVDCQRFTLVDSPGIRSMSLDDIMVDELIDYFPDLIEIALSCRFTNCQHDATSKGCSFNNLADQYSPENLIEVEWLLSRLSSYKKIHDELNQTPAWDKKI